MTLIEKIDAIFIYLYNHSGKNPDFTDLRSWFKSQIEEGEIRDILLKLKKDGLIYTEVLGDMNADYRDHAHFLINFDGKYFKETIGSFANKIKEENDLKEALRIQNSYPAKLNSWTRRLTYATMAAALLIVLWDAFKTLWLNLCH